jgi:hypothetical protein
MAISFDNKFQLKFTVIFCIFILTIKFGFSQGNNFPYSGKIVAGKGPCAWLILIEDGPEKEMIGKLIEPSGNLPEHLQKKRKKVIFNFYPLRQPVSLACKSDIVGSIASIEEK